MHKHNLFTFNFNPIAKFIGKLLLLIGILFTFFYHVSCQYQDNYNAALIDKVARLNSLNEPKIVLLGNSNLSFGIDSQMIEEELNMPVINMGLHGSLGNAFHEEMAKFNVTEGDIYVLCHTSYSSPDSIELPELAWITLENHFELYQILRFQDVWPMIKAYPIYLKKCLTLIANAAPQNTNTNTIYSRQAFNKYGDIAVERTQNKYEFSNKIIVPTINDETAQRINKLSACLNDKGATLVIAGYPIANGNMTPDKKEYENFQFELEKALHCDVISDFTNYMFDYQYFYDTDLHLTTEGAKLRTAQLIKDLQKWKN